MYTIKEPRFPIGVETYMTTRKIRNANAEKIGRIIYEYRMGLSLPSSSREYFIEDRVETGLLLEGWISTKSLTNIELGKNFPSYTSLKLLSTALEVDFLALLKNVGPYMPDSLNEIWILLKEIDV